MRRDRCVAQIWPPLARWQKMRRPSRSSLGFISFHFNLSILTSLAQTQDRLYSTMKWFLLTTAGPVPTPPGRIASDLFLNLVLINRLPFFTLFHSNGVTVGPSSSLVDFFAGLVLIRSSLILSRARQLEVRSDFGTLAFFSSSLLSYSLRFPTSLPSCLFCVILSPSSFSPATPPTFLNKKRRGYWNSFEASFLGRFAVPTHPIH